MNYHGKREYGKDLVLGEIDRFSNFTYHGVQAKFSPSIGQKESEGLIDDCQQAFRHQFQHPVTGEQWRICFFIVVNAGSFGDNTSENFLTDATNHEHGGHVRLLDGKALLTLDRSVTTTRVEGVRAVLTGLRLELQYNRDTLEFLLPEMKSYIEAEGQCVLPIERLRSEAMSHFLHAPFRHERIDIQALLKCVHVVDRTNRALAFLTSSTNTLSCLSAATFILEQCGRYHHCADPLDVDIMTVLSSLGPLAAV